MSLSESIRRLENRFYAAIRHPAAALVAEARAQAPGLDAFEDHRHCLVVSYRRSGEPVATPVWCAVDGDRLVFESDADSLKLKRIRRNPRVRVAPCTVRGRALGPPVDATARILDAEGEGAAERALDRRHGWARRVVTRLRTPPPAGLAYVEVTAFGS